MTRTAKNGINRKRVTPLLKVIQIRHYLRNKSLIIGEQLTRATGASRNCGKIS